MSYDCFLVFSSYQDLLFIVCCSSTVLRYLCFSVFSNVTSPDNSRYPDAIAIKCDDASNRLTCVYNDHSFYVWDVSDVRKVAKTRSFLFHSGPVWGVDVSVVCCFMVAFDSFCGRDLAICLNLICLGIICRFCVAYLCSIFLNAEICVLDCKR